MAILILKTEDQKDILKCVVEARRIFQTTTNTAYCIGLYPCGTIKGFHCQTRPQNHQTIGLVILHSRKIGIEIERLSELAQPDTDFWFALKSAVEAESLTPIVGN